MSSAFIRASPSGQLWLPSREFMIGRLPMSAGEQSAVREAVDYKIPG
ncbi:hypothetical protein [Kribbella pittospori]|nr:hypothetical protein [Kribbella pittospori]